MTKMDDEPHPECDLYVEDDHAAVFLLEILAAHAPHLVQRCQPVAYGAGSVGEALVLWPRRSDFPGRHACSWMVIGDHPMDASFCQATEILRSA
jgi:hypothetical protein